MLANVADGSSLCGGSRRKRHSVVSQDVLNNAPWKTFCGTVCFICSQISDTLNSTSHYLNQLALLVPEAFAALFTVSLLFMFGAKNQPAQMLMAKC